MTSKLGEPWTEHELDVLRRRYANEATADIARDLGRTVGATYARAKAIGAKKSREFLASPASGRVKGNMNHRAWSAADLNTFRARYPHEKTEAIASDLKRTVAACYGLAKKEGLRKTDTYLATPDAGRTDGTIGQGSRFRKGHRPVNKGQKGWQAGGRSVDSQFKPGQQPKNFCPVGSYRRTTKENYWVVKVQNTGTQRERWIPLHKLLWIEHNGPIPANHIVRFIDGDPDNVVIGNLECLTMKENMLRNTIHNLPPVLVDVIRTKGVLTRTINQRRKEDNEEQTRRPA